MKMEANEILENHEERIRGLEDKIKSISNDSQLIQEPIEFTFSNKNENHNNLLKELLQSDYCHSKNGLLVDEILEIFKKNNRPVNPKKIKDLLSIWKSRSKIESIKSEGGLRYFWIENG